MTTTTTTENPGRARLERGSLLVGGLFVFAWPFALSTLRRGDVYAVMGPFAIVAIVALATMAVLLHEHGKGIRRVVRDIGIGLVVGVVMTLLTYVAYWLAIRIVPSLASHVAGLYDASHTESFGPAMAWTLIVLTAEEMLWRGVLLHVLERRIPRRIALAVSLLSYTAAQSGGGSVVIVLAAVVCGAIWLAERALTGSIVAGLVSHLVWTPIVIHIFPVTAIQ